MNFLDMNLSYSNNNITTSIYKKPTHTGTYWNFSSQHHFSQKVGLVKALIYRAFTLINDTTKRNIEINNIKKELINEDFPIKVINRIIEDMNQKYENNTLIQNLKCKNKEAKFITLPFINQKFAREILLIYSKRTMVLILGQVATEDVLLKLVKAAIMLLRFYFQVPVESRRQFVTATTERNLDHIELRDGQVGWEIEEEAGHLPRIWLRLELRREMVEQPGANLRLYHHNPLSDLVTIMCGFCLSDLSERYLPRDRFNWGAGLRRTWVTDHTDHLSPAYKLSKYLSSYLTPLVKTRPQSHSVTDIPAFIQFIQSLTPIQNSTMVSYDVKSMYLSLPHQLIISQLTKFLQDAQLESGIVATIVALTSICLNTTDFTFNDLLYKQIRGSPMGSPLSPPLAEIVMSTLDTWIQQQFTPGIHIWRRYIDDILCICETGQENSILSVLNSFHPDIYFSFESESNNVIPFLDILIIRTPSHYHTTVYHKINNPTFYTNFKSYCPLSHKINTVRTLTKRLVTHCSLPIFRSIEFANIKKQLALSQYPHQFIYKYQYNPAHTKPNLPHRNTCILPYSTQSAAISHLLKPHGINTYYTNNRSLATILRHPITRLPRPASAQSSGGSVYSVSCNDCSATYIGETGRSVAIRMTEHGRCVNNKDNRSLIYSHILDTGHSFDLTSSTTLYNNITNKYQRLIIEAILSISKNSINRHIDLPAQYQDICINLNNR
ncbi:hypothetical protein LAZ67_14001896 [Cordylochernes scorpioides]|uniref:Reverse transcriptase domain-containing protein n=1 Tax=Cordylochernes scorpioides TaxID=51811 RepID=A0ABY6L6D8_9ARAC|nr:hypothetical protein LAZ67_14001896 [Cordylochernes scorpioides]